MRKSSSIIGFLALAVGLLAATTGCGSQNQATGDSPQTPFQRHASSPTLNVERAASAFGAGLDESTIASPKDYLEGSELVVAGTVQNFTSGRVIYAEKSGEPGALTMLIMSVGVDKVIKGDPPADGKAYVEVPQNGFDPDYFNEAVPPGTPVALYLYPAISETEEIPIGNDDAGLPQGSQIWTPMGSQAITFEVDKSSVVMPMIGTSVIKGSLAQQLP